MGSPRSCCPWCAPPRIGQGLSDELAGFIVRPAGYDERSDLFYAVRRVVSAWRSAGFCARAAEARTRGIETENQFLVYFDLGYRIRRLTYLRQQIEAALAAKQAVETPSILLIDLRDTAGQPRLLSAAESSWLQGVHAAIAKGLESLYGVRRSLRARGAANPRPHLAS